MQILITEKLFLCFDLSHPWGPWKTYFSGGLLEKESNIAATLADSFETAPSCRFSSRHTACFTEFTHHDFLIIN